MAADITDKHCAEWRDEHGAAEFQAADQCEVEGRSFREVVVREVIRQKDAVGLYGSVQRSVAVIALNTYRCNAPSEAIDQNDRTAANWPSSALAKCRSVCRVLTPSVAAVRRVFDRSSSRILLGFYGSHLTGYRYIGLLWRNAGLRAGKRSPDVGISCGFSPRRPVARSRVIFHLSGAA